MGILGMKPTVYSVALCVGLSLAACGGESNGGQGGGLQDNDEEDGKSDSAKADAGKKDGGSKDAGPGVKVKDGGAGSKSDGGGSQTGALTALPGAVCGVLQKNGCLTCHSDPPQNNAPASLLTAADFATKATTGADMGTEVLKRVRDPKSPMPPVFTTRPTLTDADVKTLKDWIDGGATGVQGAACDPDGSSTVVPGAIPEWAQQPWPEEKCERVITLGAHGGLQPVAQDPSGYPIPTSVTDYHCFYEQVKFDKPMKAIALRARLESPDDQLLVHHLVVSGQEAGDSSLAGSKPNFPGDQKHCDNPTGSTLAVYAPGAQNPITTPSDVGILLPSSGSYFELQVHYNNPKGMNGKQSRVQYDICVTSQDRPQTAGTFWLGFENAGPQTITSTEFLLPLDNKGNGKAVGQCSAKTQGRILSIMPHMHEHGKHANVAIKRASGSSETIIDSAFSFQDQASFFWDNLTVQPGDNVISTCEWDTSPVSFGFASTQEMCFFYTLAYPLEVFKANPVLGEKGLVGGNLACAYKPGP